MQYNFSRCDRRSNRRFASQPNIALNDERDEYLCPLCKTITNSILPIYSDVQIMPVEPSTMEEKTDHALELFVQVNPSKIDSEKSPNRTMTLQFVESVLGCSNLDSVSDQLSIRTIQRSIDSLMEKYSSDCRFAKNLLLYYTNLQGLYSVCASLAYTLLTATVCQIKERDCGNC